ncbi:DNA polymerase I [Rhodococcus phage WC1]|nr:DNA polymerase I [Rhodococcus phage Gollum]AWY05794.1 DNA polymerase I [Rhodococcus phage Phrankenstein]AWY06234.1 DNA polymerase I [Rhodococcus phage Swann]QXH81109.1 DNA polymerase I [Rhodococcus phage WC1]
MQVIPYEVSRQPVRINVVETEDDLDGFRDFVRANLNCLGADTETTGLDIYSDSFRVRVAQFGTSTESWIIPVERGGRYVEDVVRTLKAVKTLVFQNASYDLQVIEQTMGIPMESLWHKIVDTKILAHLVDPRGREEGGSGHSLEELTAKYIDKEIAEGVKSSMKVLAQELKTTKDKVWKVVEYENPTYRLYSGMDPILAHRLYEKLWPMVPSSARPLIDWEHDVAMVCSIMERTGFLLDVDYSEQLSAQLLEERDHYKEVAKGFGCENVNSTDQVADVLESRGVLIPGRTKTGKRQVDKVLLEDLVKQGDPFAQAVVEAKRAGKWEKTWVRTFLDKRDSNDRCHANINPLRARTGRMSITGIPAQTLPSGDWMIRRCFLADEGHRIASIDYQTQELRVLAALSGDQVMLDAFRNDKDLHQITADAASVPRKVGKMANFLTVYGGGAGALAVQAGIDADTAKSVLDAFGKTYPKVKVFSRKLQSEAGRRGYITTPTGRRLPVDPARAYSALNYMVQSTSRDVTCRALLKLHDAGFTPYLRLPIHDEVVASVPEAKADWGAAEIGRLMAEQMGPVFIGTDPEVGLRSWGSMYGASY